MRKRSLLSCMLLIVAALFAFAGCTKKASSTDAVVVGIQQDLDSLDPHKVEAAGTREVLFNVFEGLVKPSSTGEMKGAVAESYTVNDAGTEYTFVLRQGVKFHNGQTVTAEDVKYSLDRAAGKLEGQEAPLVSDFKTVDSVEIVDEKTIKLTLSSANTEFIAFMTAAIIPKGYDDQAKNPVGTGPYKYVSYTPQDSFVMTRFDDYWGDKAKIKDVTFRIITNADSVVMALKAGTIDIYPYLTHQQAKELTKDFNIEVGPTNLVQALFLNNDREPLNNADVRRALNMAMNPKEIIDMVFGGYGNEIGTHFIPALSLYYDETTKDVYSYNVEKAKQLLADAGYPNGFDLEITVPGNYEAHCDTAEVLVDQFKKIGVNAKIKKVDWSTWLSDVYNGREYQSTVVGVDAKLAPGDVMKRFRSDASNNFINYKNTEYDEIYKKAIASTSQEEKIKLYHQLQQMLTKDAASVYIQDPAKLVAVKKGIEGFLFYPLYVIDMSTIEYK